MKALEHLEALDPATVGNNPRSLHDLVLAAITATRAAVRDESIDDLVQDGNLAAFEVNVEAARKLLAKAHKALAAALISHTHPAYADAILVAARQFPPPRGRAIRSPTRIRYWR